MHFASRGCGDNRGDLLAADGNLDFCHQTADANRIDASPQLIAPTDPADGLLSFVFRSAASPEKQFVDLALGDAVMSSGGWDTAYSLFVNPLLNGGEADSQLQCGVWQPKHLLCISSQFYWLPHQNGILASKFGTVNIPGLR